MRSWQLLPALVALAAAACYLPDGSEADEEWVPCNKVDAFSFCCQDGDTCLENGLCLAASGIQTGACQNSGWSGCHQQIPATITLNAREVGERAEFETVTTVVVVATQAQSTDNGAIAVGEGYATTVVVVATHTRSVVVVTASSTQNPINSATAEPTKSPRPKQKLNLPLIIGCAAGGTVGLAIITGVICFCLRQRKRRADDEFRDEITPEMMIPTVVTPATMDPPTIAHNNWRRPIIMRDKKMGPHVAEIGGSPVTNLDEDSKTKRESKAKEVAEIGGGVKSDIPAEMDDGVHPVEIDDGRRHAQPVEMDAGRSPPTVHQPPWVDYKDVYEMG